MLPAALMLRGCAGAPRTPPGLSFPASGGSPAASLPSFQTPLHTGSLAPHGCRGLAAGPAQVTSQAESRGQGRVTRARVCTPSSGDSRQSQSRGSRKCGARAPPTPRRRMLRAEHTELARQADRPPAAEAPGRPGQGTPTVILPPRWLREHICCDTAELSHLKVATAWRTLGGDFPHDCGDKGTA